jgi:hypothetical protein
LKKIAHYSSSINIDFENGSEILPSNGKDQFYDLLEEEIFKITFVNK